MAKSKKKRFALYNKSDKAVDKILTTLLFPLRLVLYYIGIQVVFRLFFKVFHRIKFSKNGFKLPLGPFLVLGNHVSNCDGIYHNIFLKRFIYFIVHDELFKYKFSKCICYNLLGQVKRGENAGDITFMRKLTELRDAGKCIGIFPEGDISYVDKNLDINISISKLAKLLGMPIVLVRIDGGRFRVPRWAKKNRYTKVNITIADIIQAEDLKGLSVKTLHDRILSGISYDDQIYQRQQKNIIRSSQRAENLQNILFFCPDCNSLGTLNSKQHKVFCENCGYTVTYNKYGAFEAVKAKNVFLDIREWDNWQQGLILNEVLKTIENKNEIIKLHNVKYFKVNNGEYFYRSLCIGTLYLNYQRLQFVSDDKTIIEEYPLKEIKDLYIQFKGAPEFVYNQNKYRFISADGKHYGYWFECFILEILKNQDKIESFIHNPKKQKAETQSERTSLIEKLSKSSIERNLTAQLDSEKKSQDSAENHIDEFLPVQNI